MSHASVVRLAGLDLSLHRKPAILYALAATAGAALCTVPGPVCRSTGLSLVMCILIAQCFHFPISTVLNDITRGTRAFTLSLPVTPGEYAAGKLLANITLFLVPATAIAAAVLVTPAEDRIFPVPVVLLMLLGCLIFFVQNLGVAMVTESVGVGMACLVTSMFVMGNIVPALARGSSALLTIWSSLHAGGTVVAYGFGLFLVELAGSIAVILLFMRRKRSYL